MTRRTRVVEHDVVIVAAGRGTRFGSESRKCGLEVGGKPLTAWSVDTWSNLSGFGRGVLVVPADATESETEDWIPKEHRAAWIRVVGGEHRADSVVRGLRALSESMPSDATDRLVAVHDAARPLLSSSDALRVVAAAARCGAAILARPVTDSLKRVEGSVVEHAVDRRDLWRAETPQVASINRLMASLGGRGGTSTETFTDEAAALESLGDSVEIVRAEHPNPKLTVSTDLPFVEWQLIQRS